MAEPELLGPAAAFDSDGALGDAADQLTTTRRGLFAVAAAGTVLGGLVRPASALSRDLAAADVAILNYALGLEYLQAAFYTEAERLGALHGPLATQARVVGGHERAHVAAFRKVLGRSAIKTPTFNFQGVTQDPSAFRRTAVAFEDLAVAAYKYQAPHLSSTAYLMAAVSIHSVEARHAAWIRRLAGVLPAATPFDQPLAPSKVEALVASTHFVVGTTQTSAHRSPKFTG
ncbi:MAG: ferritin-like domain-containing protein [Solirubrobacteraceae bacterium]